MRPNSRVVVLLISIAVFLGTILVCAGPSVGVVWYRLVTDGGVTILWVLAAAGIGWPILRMFEKGDCGLFFYITSAAVGMGLMSLVVLGLGLAGWLNQTTGMALVALGLGLFVSQLSLIRLKLRAWAAGSIGWGWLWIAAMLPAGLAFVGAMVPPGLLWGDEPNGYDVVEYHLQVPRQWYEAGRITPLKENVFSYFPQGVEMHYLLAMELCGGTWRGMYLAQLMHVAMCGLAVAAVASAGGTAAGVIVAVTPWVALLAPVAYVEGGVLLYGSLALAWGMRGIGKADWRPMIVAGAMAGFACGVKLTDVPMLLVAIPVALFIADVRACSVKQCAAVLAAGAIVLSPWLIRTLIWSGNPVFPEAMNWLGHAHFSAIQVERWRRAYLPTTGRMTALWGQILADWRYGYVLLPMAVIAAIRQFKSARARFLLAMLILLSIIWIGCTHLQSRFFVLAIPIAALLIAETGWRCTMIGVITFLLIDGIRPVGNHLAHFLDLDRQLHQGSEIGLLGRENLTGLRGPPSLPAEARLDLVGDVEPFLYQIPMSRFRYRTVFDVDSSDPAKSVVEDWLGGSSVPEAGRMIVIDPAELSRLSRTYYGIPRITESELTALAVRPDVYLILPGH